MNNAVSMTSSTREPLQTLSLKEQGARGIYGTQRGNLYGRHLIKEQSQSYHIQSSYIYTDCKSQEKAERREAMVGPCKVSLWGCRAGGEEWMVDLENK